ncbi:alanine-tRNA synthetase second additional domain-containing protein [Providencia rettgeri]|uniref:alanine-tRNA synthetase second additional domain-containing protein n=1 Tax=Providencia rettgeri TaxID=587 RepID=UPI001C671088
MLESITNLLPDLAVKANEIILEDHQIQTGFDDEINERRYWKIEGFSKVPCGGTHVRSTAEIGTIRLKRVNIGKGKERVEIYLND